jgi:hypothetical protein
VKSYYNLRVFIKLGYLSYFFSAICKSGLSFFGVLLLHVCFVFVVVIVVSQVYLCYIRFSVVCYLLCFFCLF